MVCQEAYLKSYFLELVLLSYSSENSSLKFGNLLIIQKKLNVFLILKK